MHWQGQQLLPTSSYTMENRSSNSRNLGNVSNEQIVNVNGSEVIQQEDDNLKLVQSCKNINNFKLVQSCKNYLWKKRYYICVLLAVLVVGFFAGYLVRYYVEQSYEGNDHSKMVNQTSTVCLEDVQIRLADHLDNNPILDCIDYNRNITVQKCAKLCRKGGHIYECRSHGGKNITMISVENFIPCKDGNPKHYDIEIENDKFCFCAPFDFKSLKIYNAGD